MVKLQIPNNSIHLNTSETNQHCLLFLMPFFNFGEIAFAEMILNKKIFTKKDGPFGPS